MFVLFLYFYLPVYTQEVIDDGQVVTFILNGKSPTIFTYPGQPGDVLTITARTLHNLAEDEHKTEHDTVVYVIAPSGKHIAYNDNHQSQHRNLLKTDSVIPKLVLTEAGDYHIHINTYGGIFITKVELTIQAVDLFEMEQLETDEKIQIRAVLPQNHVFSHIFKAEIGQKAVITVRDLSFTLDPLVRVFSPDGKLLDMNDDHDSHDLALDILDSRSKVVLPVNGLYTVEVIDFLGREGRFELVLEYDP